MSEHNATEHDSGHDGAPHDHGGAHDAPEAHEAHGSPDAHGGHDDHGAHGSGQWVDYNALPPSKLMLPPIPAFALVGMTLVLALLLGTIVNASLMLAAHEGHAEHAAGTHSSSEKTGP